MYLKHIEHSPENLEFYVWFKNYEAGRLTGISSRPTTGASTDKTFDFAPSQQMSMGDADEKGLGFSESKEAINPEYGTSPLPKTSLSLISNSRQQKCTPKFRLS